MPKQARPRHSQQHGCSTCRRLPALRDCFRFWLWGSGSRGLSQILQLDSQIAGWNDCCLFPLPPKFSVHLSTRKGCGSRHLAAVEVRRRIERWARVSHLPCTFFSDPGSWRNALMACHSASANRPGSDVTVMSCGIVTSQPRAPGQQVTPLTVWISLLSPAASNSYDFPVCLDNLSTWLYRDFRQVEFKKNKTPLTSLSGRWK